MPPHSSQYCFKIIQTINVLVEFFLFTCNPFISIEISLFLQLDFSVTFAKIFYYCYKNCSGETNTCKCRPYCIMHNMIILQNFFSFVHIFDLDFSCIDDVWELSVHVQTINQKPFIQLNLFQSFLGYHTSLIM